MKQLLVTVVLISGLVIGACSDKGATDPPAPATLALSLGSTAAEITQGGSVAVTVNVTRAHFDGAVAVTVSGVSGVTASPLSIPAGATGGVLTLTADRVTAPGAGMLTIAAAGPAGTPTNTATLAFAVNVRGTYTLSLAPAAVSLFQGGVATTTITTARENNFAGTVTLTVQAPAGLTATLTPNTLSGTTTAATLSVTAAAGIAVLPMCSIGPASHGRKTSSSSSRSASNIVGHAAS